MSVWPSRLIFIRTQPLYSLDIRIRKPYIPRETTIHSPLQVFPFYVVNVSIYKWRETHEKGPYVICWQRRPRSAESMDTVVYVDD